jgi:hypothetical protein
MMSRAVILILAALLLIGGHSAAATLWTGGHESGDLREWYSPCPSAAPCGNEGGGEFNSGDATSVASTDSERTGTYGAKLTIDSTSEAGVRLFRWAEGQTTTELYYVTWSYIPSGLTSIDGFSWWMHEGWKVRRTQGGAVNNMIHLNLVHPFGANDRYLELHYFPPQGGSTIIHTQSIKQVPLAQWFMTETYLREATTATGQVIVWLDGTEIFNINNIVTRGSGTDGDVSWEVVNYADHLTPATLTKYVDDAQISTTRVGSPLAPKAPTNLRVVTP